MAEMQTCHADRQGHKGLNGESPTGTNGAGEVEQHSLSHRQQGDLVKCWLLGVGDDWTPKG